MLILSLASSSVFSFPGMPRFFSIHLILALVCLHLFNMLCNGFSMCVSFCALLMISYAA